MSEHILSSMLLDLPDETKKRATGLDSTLLQHTGLAAPDLSGRLRPFAGTLQTSIFSPLTPGARTISNPMTVLLVVPTLEPSAAMAGVVDLVHILSSDGHKPIVISRGGDRQSEIIGAGADVIALDVASQNPLVMIRNVASLIALIRKHDGDVIHVHGRAAAWSAYLAARLTGIPLVTTWHKGFRQQNILKRIYNSAMARGDRVVAVSDQIADLIVERHRVAESRISVITAAIDVDRFDPADVSPERIERVRRSWGIGADAKVILVVGRMLRRKGHHVMVKAAQRLKQLGLKDFVCVFAAPDHGRTRYGGEVWDLVMTTDTADVIRFAGPADDLPAVYAAASVAVSSATQQEGIQRALLEAQAMERPVIVSDIGVGSEVVLAPPAVSEARMTGLRFPAEDDSALAASLIRLFAMPEQARRTMGQRGRVWVRSQFNAQAIAEQTLSLYAAIRHPGTARR